jgi:hypothetical protein
MKRNLNLKKYSFNSYNRKQNKYLGLASMMNSLVEHSDPTNVTMMEEEKNIYL